MYAKIDSMSMIYKLKKDDILFDPIKSERFTVNEINEEDLILCDEKEPRALRIVKLPSPSKRQMESRDWNEFTYTFSVISTEELKEKTGYSTFLKFRRNCSSNTIAFYNPKLTTYYYDQIKKVDLDTKPQELLTAAAEERQNLIKRL